jgi:hypothetical protein
MARILWFRQSTTTYPAVDLPSSSKGRYGNEGSDPEWRLHLCTLLLPSRATNKGASGIEQGERKSCKVYFLFLIEQLRNAGEACDENFLVSERYRATLSAQLIFYETRDDR